MIDRTREDITQDARLERIEKKLAYLEKLIDAMDAHLDELRPAVVIVQRTVAIVERIEQAITTILGKLHV